MLTPTTLAILALAQIDTSLHHDVDETATRAGILAAHTELDAIQVVYETTSEIRGQPEGAYLHRELQCLRPNMFSIQTSHGSASLHWQSDPYALKSIVSKNEIITIAPASRGFFKRELSSTAALPDSLPEETFLLCTGLSVVDGREPTQPFDVPHSLVAVLKSRDYVLASSRELVNGITCEVLWREGRDRIWVSPIHRYALVAREIYTPTNQEKIVRFDCKDFELFGAHYMPRSFAVTYFDPHADYRRDRTRIVKHTEYKLLTCVTNGCTEADFQYSIPEGSVDLGILTNSTPNPASEGGIVYLDSLVDLWRQNHFSVPTVSWITRFGRISGMLLVPVVLVCLALSQQARRVFRIFQKPNSEEQGRPPCQ